VRGYSLKDVSAKTGLPRRTIIDWAEKGVVRPALAETSGSGTHRRYDEANLLEFMIAKELLALGVPGRRAKVLLATIRSRVGVRFCDDVGAVVLAVQGNRKLRIVQLSPAGDPHWRNFRRLQPGKQDEQGPITFVVIDVDAARRRLAEG
jgi:hypothetical protein